MSHHEHHHHDYQDNQSEEENSSQVRSIIRQLNEERPSQEKHREVVVRPDGTKAVRVTKKRKVMVTKEEHRRRGRRAFMAFLFTCLLALGVLIAFFAFRMSTMSGETYLAQRSQELAELWGAKEVRCTGAVIDGFKFRISNIVADFPEDSLLKRVELSELEAELDMGTFFNGKLIGDEMSISRAHIHLNPAVKELRLPQLQGETPWRFARISCPEFSISYAPEGAKAWAIEHSSAYMYHPSESSTMTVVTLDGGTMKMRGWKDIHIETGKVQFSQLAIEEFSISGTTDHSNSTTESSRTSLVLSGSLADGAALAGPYSMVADNMNMTEFTEGRYNSFLSARTVRPPLHSGAPSTHILLPLEQSAPKFSGTFHLKEVIFSGFPAQQLMLEHIEPIKRKRYMPPQILMATANLSHEGETMVLSFDESDMVERDVITLRGSIRVNDVNELSGTLDYGLPSLLTRTEYRDGKADPIFREKGQTAWLATKLSGLASRPEDDSRETDARAEEERAQRERIPFENIDLEQLNAHFRNREAILEGRTTPSEASGEPGSGLDGRLDPARPMMPGDNTTLPGEHPLDSPF